MLIVSIGSKTKGLDRASKLEWIATFVSTYLLKVLESLDRASKLEWIATKLERKKKKQSISLDRASKLEWIATLLVTTFVSVISV